jgi:hypothetical protein
LCILLTLNSTYRYAVPFHMKMHSIYMHTNIYCTRRGKQADSDVHLDVACSKVFSVTQVQYQHVLPALAHHLGKLGCLPVCAYM